MTVENKEHNVKLHESGEDYLEAVLILQKRQGMVRSVDLAEYMGYKKPSISRAVKILKSDGFLIKDEDGFLYLTEEGRKIAEKTYEKHCFFTVFLTRLGVDARQAEQDACRIEHVISETSFEKIKQAYDKL